MTKIRPRSAEIFATLVYFYGPQLILLNDKKTKFIAIAIPDDDEEKSLFLATLVSEKDFDAYMEGSADLRYLFTYPRTRRIFTFDLETKSRNRVSLFPHPLEIPEEFLPAPRLFSDHHTHDLPSEEVVTAEEILYVDGEWDMPDFGKFYQRYSEIYSFLAALVNWNAPNLDHDPTKKRVLNIFQDTPFKGGFSYVHFFSGLVSSLRKDQRIGLDKISYASPGTVNVSGNGELFKDVSTLITHYLRHSDEITEKYNLLHKFLSERRLLRVRGHAYDHDPVIGKHIEQQAAALAMSMQVGNHEVIRDLVNGNDLVFAKIILSLYRRLDETASFYAQGRVSFES